MLLLEDMKKQGAILKCPSCGQAIEPNRGCTTILYLHKCKAYARVKAKKNCKDCLVKRGQYHHVCCEEEICPVCHGLPRECDCAIRYF